MKSNFVRQTWNKIRYKYWKVVPYNYRPLTLWYRLKCRLCHRYNVVYVKTLPSTWCDRDDLLLHATFQILVDFIENEHEIKSIWYEDKYCTSRASDWIELYGLYSWWKYDYPNPLHEKTLDKAVALDQKTGKNSDEYYQILDLYGEQEEAFEKLTTEKLQKLMELRGYLWT